MKFTKTLLLLDGLCTALVSSAQAATITWANNSSGNWDNPANWDTLQVPTTGDHAILNKAVIVTVTPTATFGILDFSAGTIAGSLVVASNAVLNWSGGRIQSAAGSLTVVASGSLNVSGAVAKYLDVPLTNSGNVVWSGTGPLAVEKNGTATYAGVVYNLAGGLFDMQNDATFTGNGYPSGAFNNADIVRKSAGVATSTFSLPLNNTGSVQVQSGTLALANGGSIEGTWDAAASAAVNFTGGSFNFGSSTNVAGSGMGTPGGVTFHGTLTMPFDWSGGLISGSFTIGTNGRLNVTGSTTKTLYAALTNANQVVWSGGTWNVWYDGSPTHAGRIYNLPGATFDIKSDASLANAGGSPVFYNGGTLRKSAGVATTTFGFPLNNTSTVELQSGTLALTGGGSIEGSWTAAASAAVNFSGGTFDFGPSYTWSGPGFLGMASGGATFTGKLVQTFSWTGGGIYGLNVGTNGLLSISGGAIKYLYGPLNNEGNVAWSGGQLSVQNNGSTLTGVVLNQPGGLFDIQSNTTLADVNGSEVFTNAGTLRKSINSGAAAFNLRLNNAGTVEVQAGSLALAGGGNIEGTWTAAAGTSVNFSGGVFAIGLSYIWSGTGLMGTASGSVAFTGTLIQTNFNWTGGAIYGLNIGTNGLLNVSGTGTKYLDGPLTNAGSVVWSGTGVWYIRNNTTTYTGVIYNLAGGLFDIQTAVIFYDNFGGEVFNNAGTLRKSVNSGTSTFNPRLNNTGTVEVQAGSLALAGGGDIEGTWTAAAGTSVNFSGGVFDFGPSYTWNGSGLFGTASGTVTFNGTMIQTNFNWTGGIIYGLNVGTNGLLSISGPSIKYLYGSLTNAGTVVWTNTGQLNAYNNGNYNGTSFTGAVYNLAGALFDAKNDVNLVNSYGGVRVPRIGGQKIG